MDTTEVEWQFDAVDLRPVIRWLEERDEEAENRTLKIKSGGSTSQLDIYFDTEDRRFHRAGDLTGRGNPVMRGAITGLGTFTGGILHTLPFLIPHYRAALIFAGVVVVFELIALAWLRWRFFRTSFVGSLGYVTLAGIVIGAVSATLGVVG